MKTLNENKNAIVSLIVIVLVLAGYKYFFSGAPIVVDTSGQDIGNDVLELNQRLQTVNLDRTVFSSPGYRALIDFSTVVQDQPKGRPNPFDPI
ncbi:MAG: hypothetical protein JWL80_399 [Parcubacteria group bacterium]|nr:hypothetical protein [Parcubacteria group bacterium]